MLMFVILLALYFVPAGVAIARGHRQAVPIGLLNIFLGWTLVGWVWALCWSATNAAPPVVIVRAANEVPGWTPPKATTPFDGQY